MPLQPPPAGSLRARILAGETLFGSFVSGGSAIHAELLARAGFDWLIVDLEHGAGTESELMGQLHAIGDRTTAIVRPQSGERLRIGRALDLGAAGIMVPRLETVDEVREALPYLRYPPDGHPRPRARDARRPAGRGRPRRHRGAERVGRRRVPGRVAARRSRTPPRSPPSTASTSCSSARPTCRTRMGIPGQFERAGVRRGAADRDAPRPSAPARPPGSSLRTAADAPRYLDLGYRFIGIGSDLDFVIDGRGVVEAVRPRLSRSGRRASTATARAGRLRPQLAVERRRRLRRPARPIAGLGDHDADEDQRPRRRAGSGPGRRRAGPRRA